MKATKLFWENTDIWIWKFNQSQYFGNIFEIAMKITEIYSFLMELQKELSWIDKIQKVTILST